MKSRRRRKKKKVGAFFRNGQRSVTEPGPTPNPWSITYFCQAQFKLAIAVAIETELLLCLLILKLTNMSVLNSLMSTIFCRCIWIAPYLIFVEPESPGENYEEKEEEGAEERVLIKATAELQ